MIKYISLINKNILLFIALFAVFCVDAQQYERLQNRGFSIGTNERMVLDGTDGFVLCINVFKFNRANKWEKLDSDLLFAPEKISPLNHIGDMYLRMGDELKFLKVKDIVISDSSENHKTYKATVVGGGRVLWNYRRVLFISPKGDWFDFAAFDF